MNLKSSIIKYGAWIIITFVIIISVSAYFDGKASDKIKAEREKRIILEAEREKMDEEIGMLKEQIESQEAEIQNLQNKRGKESKRYEKALQEVRDGTVSEDEFFERFGY